MLFYVDMQSQPACFPSLSSSPCRMLGRVFFSVGNGNSGIREWLIGGRSLVFLVEYFVLGLKILHSFLCLAEWDVVKEKIQCFIFHFYSCSCIKFLKDWCYKHSIFLIYSFYYLKIACLERYILFFWHKSNDAGLITNNIDLNMFLPLMALSLNEWVILTFFFHLSSENVSLICKEVWERTLWCICLP